MKNKEIKNTYNHVGRPSNEERVQRKKKNLFKTISMFLLLFVLCGGIFILSGNNNFDSDNIMGNSSVKTYVFKPDKVVGTKYYSSNNKTLVDNLFEVAFGSVNLRELKVRGYKLHGLKASMNGKTIKFYTNDQKYNDFYIEKNYIGKKVLFTLYLKSSNGSASKKYLYIQLDKNTATKIVQNKILKVANDLIGKSLSGTKSYFTENEASNYNGDWCSWFAWNVYRKVGLTNNAEWTKLLNAEKKDSNNNDSFKYASGWIFANNKKGYNGYLEYRDNDNVRGNINYKPAVGDLVLFWWNGSGHRRASHVAIVSYVGEKNGKKYIETIDGNWGGKVSKVSREISGNRYIGKVDGGMIVGYFSFKDALYY